MLDSKLSQKIQVKIRKILKKSTQQSIPQKFPKDEQSSTPKFSEEVKLPSLSPNRSFKVLPKPYPVNKVNLNTNLKESASVRLMKNVSPYRNLKKSRNVENKTLKNKDEFEGPLSRHRLPGILNKSYIASEKIETKREMSNSRLKKICITPDPF